jgi:hypothetical protein
VNTTAMSIWLKGHMTGPTLQQARWYADADNSITLDAGSSAFAFTQESATVVDTVAGGSFTSGLNVPFNIASRHGSTFINAAISGTALTANLTPTALADLSTADFQLATVGIHNIKSGAIWGVDIGDAGIEAATRGAPNPETIVIDYDIKDDTPYDGSMWRWMFLPQSLERQHLNLDVSIPQGETVTITLTNTGGTAKVSVVAMGIVNSYGTVEAGAARTLRSRSVKKTAGTLTSLLRRTPSAKVGYPITLENYRAAEFWRLIDDLDGVGAVFAGPDANQELAVYGFISSAQTTAEVRGISKVKVEVESL